MAVYFRGCTKGRSRDAVRGRLAIWENSGKVEKRCFTTYFDNAIISVIESLQSADREEAGERPTLYSATVSMEIM